MLPDPGINLSRTRSIEFQIQQPPKFKSLIGAVVSPDRKVIVDNESDGLEKLVVDVGDIWDRPSGRFAGQDHFGQDILLFRRPGQKL